MGKKFLGAFVFLTILFLSGTVLALTASSGNYSVGMFGNGLSASNISSTNYEGLTISIPQTGTRNALSTSYSSNIGFFSNTYPYSSMSIYSYSISPASAVVGSTIGLYILVSGAQSVWAKSISPNAQEQIINLINGGTVNYVPSPSVVGTYSVIFYANNSLGAITSVIDSFEFTAQPSTPPEDIGGGGSVTIIEKCTYNWECTPWSVCADGKQTRMCKNIGTCIGNESRPIEEINCSEALFDVALKLKDIVLTSERRLKIKLDLAEKMGVEKIDVHVKYSILESDGYELFSQIETKAVQKNLSYEKEIEEIELKDGEYIVRVDVIYGNLQRAFAEQKIVVKDGKIELKSKTFGEKIAEFLTIGNIIYIGVILLIIVLIIIVLFAIRKNLRKIKGSFNKNISENYIYS